MLWIAAILQSASWATSTEPSPGEERHLSDILQLTTDGTHAEAYFAPDGRRLILQAVRPGDAADQIYELDLSTGGMRRLSTGEGKTTCGYFLPDGRYLFSSTHHHGAEPPPPPDRSRGYVWPLYRTFDIFLAELDGTLRQLTDSDGYDAEGTVSPDGRRIIFTSHRDGTVALYTMATDGSDLRRVEHPEGYAGGAFFSPDGRQIVFRAFYPRGDEEREQFERLLEDRALRPVNLEIYVARPDGSEARAITSNGKVNFAPFWHPDGRRLIFASDVDATRHGSYGLYLVGADGTDVERVTHREGFDGFPCFSPDGTHLVWISDRNAARPREMNVFLARWRD